MKKYDVITAMDVCVDIILYGDVAPRFHQEEQLLSQYEVMMGGSAPIFACQCAKLGLRTAGLGVVGGDALGGVFLDSLKGAGVDTDYVTVNPGMKTGVTFALCKPDDRAMLTYTGTIDALTPDDFTEDLLASARHLHVASYFLMPGMHTGYADVLKRAKAHGLTVSIDTNWDPGAQWKGVRELLPYCDVFMPNEGEIMGITGERTLEDALKSAAALVPHVALKMGERGARYKGVWGEHSAQAVPTRVVDAIGAGDSFDAGFLWAFLSGKPCTDCLKAGCATGSMSTRGAGGTSGQGHLNELLAACGWER